LEVLAAKATGGQGAAVKGGKYLVRRVKHLDLLHV
jgi:hypothetical protein